MVIKHGQFGFCGVLCGEWFGGWRGRLVMAGWETRWRGCTFQRLSSVIGDRIRKRILESLDCLLNISTEERMRMECRF